MFEQDKAYVCPNCGKNGGVAGIIPILNGVRYDAVSCACGCQWRVYYKFENPNVEVTYIPPKENEAEPASDSE